ncbi:MAG TPA: hypothetical protein DCW90_05785, partial [Lachnospiraceae bacterium]|nr:hypothetical protein [Lachnospiraceae bacterium]
MTPYYIGNYDCKDYGCNIIYRLDNLAGQVNNGSHEIKTINKHTNTPEIHKLLLNRNIIIKDGNLISATDIYNSK